jgi:hypothetical protein
LLILAEAEAVSIRCGEGGFVHISWNQSAQVSDGQPQRTAYGSVGSEARSEASGVTVDIQFFSDGAVDYQNLPSATGGDGVTR